MRGCVAFNGVARPLFLNGEIMYNLEVETKLEGDKTETKTFENVVRHCPNAISRVPDENGKRVNKRFLSITQLSGELDAPVENTVQIPNEDIVSIFDSRANEDADETSEETSDLESDEDVIVEDAEEEVKLVYRADHKGNDRYDVTDQFKNVHPDGDNKTERQANKLVKKLNK